MTRAATDVNNVTVESPSTKKDDSEAVSVDEHGYATVDPVFRLPSPQGGDVFFASVPDGVFNHVVSLTKLKEFGKLHHVLASRRQCHAHWENNLRQYVHHTEPLFDEFSSVEALRWTLFKRKIDARNWELHITQKDHYAKDKHKSLTHKESFTQVCQDGDLDIVKVMVERTQVDLEARDALYGRTPLHAAADNGHLPVVQYLCEQGADKEARDNDGETPLHKAALEGHLPVAQYLCEQGADKEARDNDGWTPLHWAALEGHLPVVQYLCEQGADKEARDEDGNTPLHRAAQEGHLPVVQYLCEHGADKEARDEDDMTPLDMAEISAEEDFEEVEGYMEEEEWLLRSDRLPFVVEYLKQAA